MRLRDSCHRPLKWHCLKRLSCKPILVASANRSGCAPGAFGNNPDRTHSRYSRSRYSRSRSRGKTRRQNSNLAADRRGAIHPARAHVALIAHIAAGESTARGRTRRSSCPAPAPVASRYGTASAAATTGGNGTPSTISASAATTAAVASTCTNRRGDTGEANQQCRTSRY